MLNSGLHRAAKLDLLLNRVQRTLLTEDSHTPQRDQENLEHQDVSLAHLNLASES